MNLILMVAAFTMAQPIGGAYVSGPSGGGIRGPSQPVYITCDTGGLDRELAACRAESAKLAADMKMTAPLSSGEIAALSFLVLMAGILVTQKVLSSLDKIVGAWRRSELPRLPWRGIGVTGVVLAMPFVGVALMGGLIRFGELLAQVAMPHEGIAVFLSIGALVGFAASAVALASFANLK